MEKFRAVLRGYRLLGWYALGVLLLFWVARMVLVYAYDIVLDGSFFLYALRMDIIVLSALLVVPLLLFTLNLVWLARVLLVGVFFVLGYLEVANYYFFEEFRTRLNYQFVEYLAYPQEVLEMVWVSYWQVLVVVVPLLVYGSYRLFGVSQKRLVATPILPKLLLLPLLLVVLFIGIRSSFDSSTPNQSFYSYTNSTIKNDIVNNTLFSLLYALYLKQKEGMPSFGEIPSSPIASLQALSPKPYDSSRTLRHHQSTHFSPKRQVVLVLMESFGSSYVGSLGGTPTTPHFDAMSKEGLFLSNMYSSSYRSNRGFEAVLSSLFPIYASTYLKLPKSQTHFWTLARTMQAKGYRTVFLYGGDSKFDTMKGFALNNGFDEVIDKYDFDRGIKRYTWGVPDEALYAKAEEILSQSDKPLFLMLFTLSAHKPFDYPEGKIEYYDQAPVASFPNAIKYADYALGEFYGWLKREDFFEDGVLAMVADHNAKIYGEAKVPVKMFRIPALFIAKDLPPREVRGVTHQIDIAPTLLDVAGVEADIPAMGEDLTRRDHSRALMIHHGAYAYLSDTGFVLYQKSHAPQCYGLDYRKQEQNQTRIKEGLEYLYGSYHIYDKRLHH